MSKKITHIKAKENLKKISWSKGYFEKEEQELKDYITQQEKQDKLIQKLKSNLISGHFEDKLEHTNKDGSSEDNMYNKGLYDMVNAIESYVLQEIKELENDS